MYLIYPASSSNTDARHIITLALHFGTALIITITATALQHVDMLVLDEADRMLDMGFEEQASPYP